MIYKYDRTNLVFKKDLKTVKMVILTCISLVAISFTIGRYAKIQSLENYEKELIVLNMTAEQNKFSEDKLVELLKELNVKFPHIVMAQSMIETGKWKSNIFKENHNLFGMKEAKQRVTTAGGTQNNHAFYQSWRESVYDYAFYQCRYLGGIHTEEEYFRYLNASYAEDPNYVSKVKSVIEKQKLRELF